MEHDLQCLWLPPPLPLQTLTSSTTTEDSNRLDCGEEMGRLRPVTAESNASSIPAGHKPGRGGTGRFKHSWKLPPYITASKRGLKYAYCKLCSSNFDISHGGFNDIKRHIEGLRHTDRLSQSSSSSPITSFYGTQAERQSNARNVTSAEVMMTQFIAMHNLPFLAADHLCVLFPSMFSDSKIAADFVCKRTKTKSIICDALDLPLKDPVISALRVGPFNLLCDESNQRGDSVKLLTILV